MSFQHPLDEDNKKAAFQRVGGLSSLALKFGTPIPSPSLSRGTNILPDLRRCVKMEKELATNVARGVLP